MIKTEPDEIAIVEGDTYIYCDGFPLSREDEEKRRFEEDNKLPSPVVVICKDASKDLDYDYNLIEILEVNTKVP